MTKLEPKPKKRIRKPDLRRGRKSYHRSYRTEFAKCAPTDQVAFFGSIAVVVTEDMKFRDVRLYMPDRVVVAERAR